MDSIIDPGSYRNLPVRPLFLRSIDQSQPAAIGCLPCMAWIPHLPKQLSQANRAMTNRPSTAGWRQDRLGEAGEGGHPGGQGRSCLPGRQRGGALMPRHAAASHAAWVPCTPVTGGRRRRGRDGDECRRLGSKVPGPVCVSAGFPASAGPEAVSGGHPKVRDSGPATWGDVPLLSIHKALD